MCDIPNPQKSERIRDEIRPVEQQTSRKFPGSVLKTNYLVLQKWPPPPWKLPGRIQDVSRNLPGRIQENIGESRKGALSRRASHQETSRKDIRISMPAFFQDPSWKNPVSGGSNLEVSCLTGEEISCLPGSSPEDPRYPGTFQVDPDIHLWISILSSWKLPGNIQAGSSWPGRFQEGGTWKYPVRLEVP
eukprot:gene16954-biopygen2097